MISTSYLNGNGTGEGSNNNNNGGGGITPFGDLSELLTGSMIDGYRFIEKFNRDMMDQFMEYQKRVVSTQLQYQQVVGLYYFEKKFNFTKKRIITYLSFYVNIKQNLINCFNVYIIFVQTVSQNRWEAERRRQDQLAIEQWRQEAREHDRQMFTIFCSALTNCNAALNILLKAKEEPSSGKKKK